MLIPAVSKVRIKKSSPNRPVLNVATALSESAVAIAPLNPLYHKTKKCLTDSLFLFLY